MLASETHERRKLLDRARSLIGGSSRFVDLAVAVDVVETGERYQYGGRYDTLRRRFTGEAPEAFERWQVGAQQLAPLRADKGRWVCVGAMGAGKTEILARACLLYAIQHGTNRNIGIVAPTQKRLRIIWQKICRLLPPAWVVATRISDHEILLCNGCTLQFVAAKVASSDVGSPIQGQSFIAAFVDEEQDIVDEVMADIMMRGRDAADGNYYVLSSCTLKDTPEWRDRKQRYDRDDQVTLHRMAATANPFVHPEYWRMLRATLTARQYRMRVLALDARPERSTYPEFSRQLHCQPAPQLGARDVTRSIVGKPYLIGHDPGTLCDVSLVLKAYQRRGESLPVWYVIGELTTEQSTTQQHAVQLVRLLAQYDATPADAIIVADPYGDRGDEHRPHVTTYKVLMQAGFKVRPAAYAVGKTGAAKPGVVPKDAGIDLVNTLLLNASGQTRLYIAVDAHGEPHAKRLVAALEMSERDAAGKAEAQRKSVADLSHWCASLRYSLWPYERARLNAPAWQERLDDGNPRAARV